MDRAIKGKWENEASLSPLVVVMVVVVVVWLFCVRSCFVIFNFMSRIGKGKGGAQVIRTTVVLTICVNDGSLARY